MTRIRSFVCLFFAVLLIAGCAYIEAKRDIAPGGRLDVEQTKAQRDLDEQKQRNATLSDEKLKREREIERDRKRISAVETELQQQDDALTGALKAKRVSQERYAKLKRELDSVRAEARSAELQNKAAAVGAQDPKADAAREAKLRDLETRKKKLESELGNLVKD
jgi:DNA repair exonuclease SbcCD ATPase subunit